MQMQPCEPAHACVCRLSWTLTPHLVTMAEGLLLPHSPASLHALAQLANPLLPAFIDAVQQDNVLALPQILLVDDLESAELVQACIAYMSSL